MFDLSLQGAKFTKGFIVLWGINSFNKSVDILNICFTIFLDACFLSISDFIYIGLTSRKILKNEEVKNGLELVFWGNFSV